MSILAKQLAQLPALAQFHALGRLSKLASYLAPVYCRCPSCGNMQAAPDALSCGSCGGDVSEPEPIEVTGFASFRGWTPACRNGGRIA